MQKILKGFVSSKFSIFAQTISMSHGKIREDKTCLNCGYTIEEKFCPNCGQENTENRKPFHYLFTHFVEDFTHYDGQFWGTIKNLLFKPGVLTETYIEGKRQWFVPPVKLYIFISFITFFLFAVFTPYSVSSSIVKAQDGSGKKTNIENVAFTAVQNELRQIKSKKNLTAEDSVNIAKLSAVLQDSLTTTNLGSGIDLNKGLPEKTDYKGFKNKKSYDAAKEKDPKFWDFIDTPVAHKFFELKEKGVKQGDILRNLAETALHNLPKALFIYLPLFAFFLWLLHNKKKWWYFEHGVFTLHYFSFLLLIIVVISLFSKIGGLTNSSIIRSILSVFIIITVIYSLIYFFIAHRKVYQNRRLINLVISFSLLFINFWGFAFLIIGLAIVSFLMIH